MDAKRQKPDPKPERPLLIDAHETARLLGISVRFLRGKKGVPGFPQPVNVGRRVLYKRAEVERWVDDL